MTKFQEAATNPTTVDGAERTVTIIELLEN